ncbi:hypothetical protein BKA93DRAFT_823078 [Sparassis latifolia]|uniref:Uncharacterized protein n=1 Tax=Sparassis crispa TaxID=139825 RepID=A0A401G5E8_9APHY|nr:hypothetical protein SCP_0102640 [Sparassis crispa]GBE77391.1 hypothetical protein SCP_0102640 [Sparassis crispa]
MPTLIVTSVLTRNRLRPSIAVFQRDTAQSEPKADADKAYPAPEPDSLTVLKASRGYEYERQRAKKSAESERMRERKERYRRAWQQSAARSHKLMPHGNGSEKRKKAYGMEMDDDENVPPCVNEERGVTEDAARFRERHELDIASLIKSAKSTTPKSKVDDFEVIANVRSVIVLDDQVSNDFELDEPWEHISIEDGCESKVAVPSYAQILSKA